jgi:hypothetical protein
MYISNKRHCEVCSARSRKMYFMKSATIQQGEKCPQRLFFLRSRKMYFTEKRHISTRFDEDVPASQSTPLPSTRDMDPM